LNQWRCMRGLCDAAHDRCEHHTALHTLWVVFLGCNERRGMLLELLLPADFGDRNSRHVVGVSCWLGAAAIAGAASGAL
jgi:hypothetical protein